MSIEMKLKQNSRGSSSIVSLNTCDPILARMSWLVKTPNNPDGIESEKLMKMSDEEIFVAYDKLNRKEGM